MNNSFLLELEHCYIIRDRPLFIVCGGAKDLGGITWLSEELRRGSAVIDRHKGGIRP